MYETRFLVSDRTVNYIKEEAKMIVTKHTEVNLKMTLKEFKVLEKLIKEALEIGHLGMNESDINTLINMKLTNRRSP